MFTLWRGRFVRRVCTGIIKRPILWFQTSPYFLQKFRKRRPVRSDTKQKVQRTYDSLMGAPKCFGYFFSTLVDPNGWGALYHPKPWVEKSDSEWTLWIIPWPMLVAPWNRRGMSNILRRLLYVAETYRGKKQFKHTNDVPAILTNLFSWGTPWGNIWSQTCYHSVPKYN